MKAIFKALLCALPALLFTQCEKEPDPNDPVDIPDQAFLDALIEDGVDTNGDGLISYAEAEIIATIDLHPDSVSKSKGKISSIEGLEAFTNLDTLHCCDNQIQELDVSANTELRVLVCWNNDKNDQLERLDVSNNIKLEHISIPGNQLSSLDVSNNADLTRLWCNGNQLSNLDVSKNTKLEWLECGKNRLTKLDVSNNSSLESLGCYGNQLISLDISKNTALGYLYCYDNQLTSLVMSDNYNFELYDLDCSENQLSSLDISNYRQLDFLHIRSMPSLFEVCVWYNPISPPLTFKIDKTGSPNVYFTNDCSQ